MYPCMYITQAMNKKRKYNRRNVNKAGANITQADLLHIETNCNKSFAITYMYDYINVHQQPLMNARTYIAEDVYSVYDQFVQEQSVIHEGQSNAMYNVRDLLSIMKTTELIITNMSE